MNIRRLSLLGPAAWQKTLDYPRSAGFASDAYHDAIHADHLHIGFARSVGTDNAE